MNNIRNEIRADIEHIEKDKSLYQEKNFSLRVQALDDIDFHIIDRIDAQVQTADTDALKQHAEKLKQSLEAVDAKMFQQLRKTIAAGCRGNQLLNLLNEYFNHDISAPLVDNEPGYDDLDVFINGLLTNAALPTETKAREPEMVFYQKTPARIILELIEKADFKPHDVFFDIGCGLGQVNTLLHLLTGITSIGIEYEPAFCNYANACAADLNLTGVQFINTDARVADYSLGTVFFMYTPFTGKMLQDVLQNLKAEVAGRKIKLYTYGPCTAEVTQQDWLMSTGEIQNALTELAEFVSA